MIRYQVISMHSVPQYSTLADYKITYGFYEYHMTIKTYYIFAAQTTSFKMSYGILRIVASRFNLC